MKKFGKWMCAALLAVATGAGAAEMDYGVWTDSPEIASASVNGVRWGLPLAVSSGKVDGAELSILYSGTREVTELAQTLNYAAGELSKVDEMRRDGMKVLAVAVRDLDGDTLRPEDEQDLTLLGYLAFFDAPKKSAGPAIARLRALQVPVKVLSGDAREVTGAVCRRLGIPCEREAEGVRVPMQDAAAAREFLMRRADLADDFEFIKGNMDDVFLSVTGRKWSEGGEA